MPSAPPPHWRDRAALGFAFALLYACLGQPSFYKTDGITLVHYADQHITWGAVHHALYLPILGLARAALAPFGVSTYRAALLVSACGSACGVAFAHAAYLRIGLDRARAALAAALAGCAPAVLFFATVVEYHGLFFGAAGVAFWVLAWASARPSTPRTLALGCATYFAASVHATGHVLPALTCGWLVALLWGERRVRALAPACIAGGTHVALLFAVPWATRALGNGATPTSQASFVTMQQFAPADLPLAFAREWLLAFAPLSLAIVLRPREPRARLEWAAMLVAMAPYMLLSWALNTGYNPSECGAYWLPLALPAARVAVEVLQRGASIALVCVCAAVGVYQIARHQDPAANRAYARDLERALGGRACMLLIGDANEAAALMIERPDTPYLPLDFLRTLSPERLQASLPSMQRELERWRAEDRDVYLTAGGRELLRLVEPACGPAFRMLLERGGPLERVDIGTFHAERVQR